MKYEITLNGKIYEVEAYECEPAATMPVAPTASETPSVPLQVPEAVSAEGTVIASPMPGSILGINVSIGQAVKAGDVLMVLEAMKMENDITAPCDGTVKQLTVSKGSTVNTDDVLAVI